MPEILFAGLPALCGAVCIGYSLRKLLDAGVMLAGVALRHA